MRLLDTATFEENGVTVLATAAWEGDVLVIKANANADAGGTIITFIERMVAHIERSSRMTSWQNAGFGPSFLIFLPKA
ncbi:MAG TPA: hypothetical protein VIH88_10865 [Candidatus Acidoferrales bacterium]